MKFIHEYKNEKFNCLIKVFEDEQGNEVRQMWGTYYKQDLLLSESDIRRIVFGISFNYVDTMGPDFFDDFNKELGKIDEVYGSLYVDRNDIHTLEGCPKIIKGHFSCGNNFLDNLEGGPEEIGGSFSSDRNHLTDLKGIAKKIGGSIQLQQNEISNIIGLPIETNGILNLTNNKLTSLEGCSKVVDSNFLCGHNSLTNLIGGPEKVRGSYSCNNNKLISLEGLAKEIKDNLNFKDNNVLFITEQELLDIIYYVGGTVLYDESQLINDDTIRNYMPF